MRYLIIIILVFALLRQMFIKTAIVLNYLANREYITQNYCENKVKPQLNCKGKCHLKKQLAEEEKQEQKLPFQNTKEKNEVLFCTEFNFHSQSFTAEANQINNYTERLFPNALLKSVFHPPCC